MHALILYVVSAVHEIQAYKLALLPFQGATPPAEGGSLFANLADGGATAAASLLPDEVPVEDVNYVSYGAADEDEGVSVEWVSEEDELRAMQAASGGDGAYLEGDYYDDEDEEGDSEKPRRAGKPIPAEVRCFDTARIFVKGGDGGRGCVAFRREKFVPRGGPSGGNGGNGGNVWLEADISLNSLLGFRRKVHFRAEPGTPGQGSDCHGAAGKDLVIKVPPGTIARRRGAGEGDPKLAEVMGPGDRVLMAVGGRGGRGNLAFKTSRNTAPTLAEFGEKGQGECVKDNA